MDLPDYMKICYLAMYIFASEMAYDALRDHGLHLLPHIKNQVRQNKKALMYTIIHYYYNVIILCFYRLKHGISRKSASS